MADSTPKSYSTDPNLWLYTSLTAGSSHIYTATSRLETILKANRIPFKALDVATDEKARMLWGRRAKGRKLPALMRMGEIVGDLEEIEEWNEFGELKQRLNFSKTPVAASISTPSPSAQSTPSKPPAAETKALDTESLVADKPSTGAATAPSPSVEQSSKSPPAGGVPTAFTMAMKAAGAEAAAKAAQNKVAAGTPLVGKGTKDEATTKDDIATKDLDEKLVESAGIAPPVTEAESAGSSSKESKNEIPLATTTISKGSEKIEPSIQTKEEEFTKAKEAEVAALSTPATKSATAEESTSKPETKKEDERDSTAVQSTDSPLGTLPIREKKGSSTPSLHHRSSSVEAASEQEIKQIEKETAIPEENDEQEGGKGVKESIAETTHEKADTDTTKHEEAPSKDTLPSSIPETEKEEGKEVGVLTKPSPATKTTTTTEDKSTTSQTSSPKPSTEKAGIQRTQEQPAAEEELAGKSVAD